MENASQALIIGGTILIAIIVLSMGVYLFTTTSKVGEGYHQAQEIAELAKFNARFTAFEGRKDITAQEIITLVNYVINYNKNNDPDIEVWVEGKNFASYYSESEPEDKIVFVQTNAPKYDEGKKQTTLNLFKCEIISSEDYSNGRVSKITFKEAKKIVGGG